MRTAFVFAISLLITGNGFYALGQPTLIENIRHTTAVIPKSSHSVMVSFFQGKGDISSEKDVRFKIAVLQQGQPITRVEIKEDELLALTIERLLPGLEINAVMCDLDLLITNAYLVKFQIALKLFK